MAKAVYYKSHSSSQLLTGLVLWLHVIELQQGMHHIILLDLE
jgi:hypothetical protein